MKKYLISLLTVFTCYGGVSAQTISVASDIEALASGETVSFNLHIAEAIEMTSMHFEVVLPSPLTMSAVNATAAWNAMFSEEAGVVGAISSSANAFNGEGDIAAVQIEVPASTPEGTYPVTVNNVRVNGTTLATTATFNVVVVNAHTVVLDETSTTAPEAAAGVNVRVKRTIKADEWSTICLPFAMTTEQVKAAFGDDVRLGDFQGCEENGEKVNVKFAEATAIEANHPYIIKVSTPVSEFTVDGVDISPEDEPMIKKDKYKSKYNSFIGNYVNGTKVDDYGLYLMGGKFWYSKGNVNVKAFRGYFVFDTIDVDYDTARMDITFDDATGIRNIGHAADAEKYYDLSGRVVSKPGKGIYVRNGQKMVVK